MATRRDTGSETDRPKGRRVQLNNTNTNALKTLLQQRLDDCGWRQSLKDIVRSKMNEMGIANVSYDKLAAEIIPQARAMVPDEVRQELYKRVYDSLEPNEKSWSDEEEY